LFWKSNLRTEQEHGARKEQTADREGGEGKNEQEDKNEEETGQNRKAD